MADYWLVLDCNKDDPSGNFEPYKLDTTPVKYPTNPHGQVWWQYTTAGVLAPVKVTGDPERVNPVVTNGDYGWVGIRDLNNIVVAVEVVVVFGKNRKNAKSAAHASPFRDGSSGTVVNRPILKGKATGPGTQPAKGDLWVFNFPVVSYKPYIGAPGGGKKCFTCFVGVIVTYQGGVERQFGLDPDMEVDDFGGTRLPPSAIARKRN